MLKEGVLGNPAITVNTFKFVEIGQAGPFGGIRVVLDLQDEVAYFVANEDDPSVDGRIMVQRLDGYELDEYRQTGAIRLMSGKSDTWDEEGMFRKGDRSDTMAISDKAYMIGGYLRKEFDIDLYRDAWGKLLEAYNSGKVILSDVTQQLMVLYFNSDN